MCMEYQLTFQRYRFNLQGTHTYVIEASNILKYPDTLLAKIIQYNGNQEEHFISQDGKLFRWIALFYNLNVLVDYTETGSSSNVWDAYVDYFGLSFAHKEVNKRTKLDCGPLLNVIDVARTKKRDEMCNRVNLLIQLLRWAISNNLGYIQIVRLQDNYPKELDEKYGMDISALYKINQQDIDYLRYECSIKISLAYLNFDRSDKRRFELHNLCEPAKSWFQYIREEDGILFKIQRQERGEEEENLHFGFYLGIDLY